MVPLQFDCKSSVLLYIVAENSTLSTFTMKTNARRNAGEIVCKCRSSNTSAADNKFAIFIRKELN